MHNARSPRSRPARAEPGNPVRVGLIGAGKFGTMFLAQARRIPDLHVLGVADLSIDRAREALGRAEWPPSQFAATDFHNALNSPLKKCEFLEARQKRIACRIGLL